MLVETSTQSPEQVDHLRWRPADIREWSEKRRIEEACIHGLLLQRLTEGQFIRDAAGGPAPTKEAEST
jgi:hypothetical protein